LKFYPGIYVKCLSKTKIISVRTVDISAEICSRNIPKAGTLGLVSLLGKVV